FFYDLAKDVTCDLVISRSHIRLTYLIEGVFGDKYMDAALAISQESGESDEFFDFVEFIEMECPSILESDQFSFDITFPQLINIINLMEDKNVQMHYDCENQTICWNQMKIDNIVDYTLKMSLVLASPREIDAPVHPPYNAQILLPSLRKIIPFVDFMGYADKTKIVLSANNQGVFKLSSCRSGMNITFVNCKNIPVNEEYILGGDPTKFATVILDRKLFFEFLRSKGLDWDANDAITCKIADQRGILFEGDNGPISFTYVMPLMIPSS
ncbi:9785_t:CDS:2, partial [Acaulospora morrowiae]